MPSLSFHEKQHILRLLAQQNRVKRIFDDFARKAGIVLTRWTEQSADSVWIRNAVLEKQVDNLLEELQSNLLTNINNTVDEAWAEANTKNDDLVKGFINDLALSEVIGKSQYAELEKGLFARNMEALKAFKNRSIDGQSISSKVWDIANGAKKIWSITLNREYPPAGLQLQFHRTSGSCSMIRTNVSDAFETRKASSRCPSP